MCTAALGAVVILCAGQPTGIGTCTPPERPVQPEAPARMQLLARIQAAMACYPLEPGAVQPDPGADMLPPTVSPFGARFLTDLNCWVGQGQIGESGTSRAAQLTISFPDDGVTWGLGSPCTAYPLGPNDLGARLTTGFGSLDRGREMIRSAIASWRKVAGLTYNEVADDNTPEDTSTVHVNSRGDIRIGATGFAPGCCSNPLAYNAFPSTGNSLCPGGDMTLNSNYFASGYFTNTIGNFLQLRNTVGHEHGHGLGFLHTVPCNGSKLMEPRISTSNILLSADEVRGVHRNYGDRYSLVTNHSAAFARNYGDLTAPIVRSVIERDLGLNGFFAVVTATTPATILPEEDWFRFTLASTQTVTITADPTGVGPSGACCSGGACVLTTQVRCTAAGGSFVLRGTCEAGACIPPQTPTTCLGGDSDPPWCQGPQGSSCSGNISSVDAQKAGNLALQLRASDTTSVLALSDTATLGLPETVTQTLGPGTYYVRVWDSGGSSSSNQIVQTYDLTIRVGTSKAPPVAIGGLNSKRVAASSSAYFIGNHNSYTTETGATIPNANYAWDLDGDGVFETTGSQPTFFYESNGTFNAVLRVTDTNGMSGTDAFQVIVFGATTSIWDVTPSSGAPGTTVPVTISGTNFKGVTSAAQVTISGTGVSVTGTPAVDMLGTTITGLSFVIAPGAAATARNVTITNSDGRGTSGTGMSVFTVSGGATTGACCATDGTCSITASGACGGAFQGVGTVCSPNPCPQPNVACCDAAGACTSATATACSSGGGTPQGFGSVCTPNPCPQPPGACCRGSTCSVLLQAACTGSFTRFVGAGVACNAAGVATTPCCLANFNQDAGVSVQDIFDYLGAWFGLSPLADINGVGGVTVQDIFDFLGAWFTGC